ARPLTPSLGKRNTSASRRQLPPTPSTESQFVSSSSPQPAVLPAQTAATLSHERSHPIQPPNSPASPEIPFQQMASRCLEFHRRPNRKSHRSAIDNLSLKRPAPAPENCPRPRLG